MSRGALVLGLVISVVAHLWLLGWRWADGPVVSQKLPDEVVEIVPVKVEDLQPQKEEEPEPVAGPEPEPAKEEPKPEPPAQKQVEEPKPKPALLPLVKEVKPQPVRSEKTGTFAGRNDVKKEAPRPELRIDWGDTAQAMSIIRAGQMKLIVLNETQGPAPTRKQVVSASGSWSVGDFVTKPGQTYSNRLRIVHDVPAFAPVVNELRLRDGQMLAVMVPAGVETMLQSAQLTATFERGLSMEQVRYFGGRFAMAGNGLRFAITRVQTRE